ncbi:HAD-IA family hydrolase [Psychromonas antarctica]|uniref:HAD-IA family hydrolase n=1 Tax=Psychromonas antarctica TaxID=67573 RepID=UPI001EE85299|nr:HAD-IA family hydrolase [Psychromonas antarctica]MCG6202683.1 HAD-IA family hydrolase [Psychromonas antarctica]
MKFKGILFDLDGTLIDSLAVVDRAWRSWAKRNSLEADHVMQVIHGRPARESVTELLGGANEAKIEQEFAWLERYESEDTQGVHALPGAVALLTQLNVLQIPWAIVTSGTLPVASARIKAAALPRPKVLITPELVKKGKPDPAPFLLGAEKLGLLGEQCLVFEDAPAGVQAGHLANCTVIALQTHFKPAQLPEADYYINSLEDLFIQQEDDEYKLSFIDSNRSM